MKITDPIHLVFLIKDGTYTENKWEDFVTIMNNNIQIKKPIQTHYLSGNKIWLNLRAVRYQT